MNTPREVGLSLAAGILLAAAAVPAISAEEPSATPYRPTVSNPAALPTPGYAEVEAGFLRTRDADPRRRSSLPVLFKYAFNENVGVLIGGEAHVRQHSDIDGKTTGVGDTNLTLKLNHSLNDGFGIGLEAGVKLPTARDLIGSGKHDKIVNGIMSAELGEAALDINLGAIHLGSVNPGESRTAYAWSTALSHAINDKWGIAGEFSGVSQRGVPGISQFLAAVSYNVSRKIVLDGGVAWGLTKASTDRALFAGMTVLLK